MRKLALHFVLGILALPLNAQLALEQPQASDGTYDKFVLVSWKAVELVEGYKVFRTTDPNKQSLQEISNGWQNSTWLCDYTALPGVDYYYSVAARSGERPSSLSPVDKGFVKKQTPMVNDQELLTSNERYAEPQRYFLMVANLAADQSSYAPQDEVNLSCELENIFDRIIPQTEIRVFLSVDSQLDWDDVQLTPQPKIYSQFPPEAKYEVQLEVSLPKDLRTGSYYLIVASSSDKELIHTKLAFIKIFID